MSVLYIVSGFAVAGLIIYLFIALIKPEMFP